MLNSKKITKRLRILTLSFIIFSLFTAITNTIVLWFFLILVFSIILIYKNKNNLKKKDILISLLLSAIVMISNVFMGIFVFPAYLASVAVLKEKDKEIALYNKSNKKEFQWTLLCIFIFGGLLACLNLLLAINEYQISLSFQPAFIFDALKAGIFEEIIFRMFLFALCIEITGNVSYNKFQEILCYILMVLPHVLVHFTGTIDFVSVIILSIFFGLPFSFMQRKLNLLSAICAHSMVDFIRFIVLGI